MKSLCKSTSILALFCVMFLGVSTLYAEEGGIKVGTLEIKALEGSRQNLIIKSSVDIEAVFTDSEDGKEYYIGEMGQKLGVDISLKEKEVLRYLVIAASSDYKTGSYALEGKYFGTKASASVVAGVGAQLLIGGLDKSFSLQPISVGEVKGVGANYGMGYLNLQKDPRR